MQSLKAALHRETAPGPSGADPLTAALLINTGKRKRNASIVMRFATFLSAILASLTCMLHAQIGGSGSINGIVIDQTDAVVSGANVTATNMATGVAVAQTTTSAGTYVLSPLTPGTYTVTIVASGFKTFTQEHVMVDALQQVGLKSQLSVGASNETVSVTGAPPPLETTDATIGISVENQVYADLPLQINGGVRNPTAFVYLTPGVAAGGSGVQTGIFDGLGSQGRTDEVYLDGFPQTSIYEQGDPRYVSNAISVEAVDQFQVVTSAPAAQFQGMGMENYVIKSGTNQLHGSVFEYMRTTALDTWGFYAPAAINQAVGHPVKPNEHQSEYGVDLGMPIRKNKVFLFGNYDGFYYHKDNNPQYTTYPTDLMRQGNFSELLALSTPQPIYDPTSCPTGSQGSGSCTRMQFNFGGVPNVINPALIGGPEKFMLQWLPTPINKSVTNNFLSQVPSFTSHWSTTGRGDWKINDKQQFSIIFSAQRGGPYGYQSNGSNPGPLPYTSGQGYETKNKIFLLEHNYTITPHMVNQLKYSFTRFWGPVFNPDYRNKGFGLALAGVTGLPAGQASLSFPTVTWGGNNALTQWSGDQDYNAMTNYFTLIDNVQWIRGRHSLTLGATHEWLELNDYTYTTGTSPVTLAYSNAQTAIYNKGTQATTSGNAFASFFIGQVNSGSLNQLPFTDTGARMRNTSLYAQDDITVMPKLTVNVGLRWDFFPPYVEVLDRSTWLDPTLINPLTGNPGALVFAGNHPYNGSGPSPYCNCSTPITNWYKNFGPRFGAAYSLTPTWVVRGGIALLFSHGTGYRNATYLGTGTVGYSASPSFTSSTTGDAAFNLNSGLPSYATPPTINAGYGTFYTSLSHGAAAAMSYADPYLGDRAPYAETWNFGVEHQITKDLTLKLNYLGSQGHFLPASNSGARGQWSNQVNPVHYNLGSLLSQTYSSSVMAQVQAIDPQVRLPYPTFAGTIAQMLTAFPQYPGINDTYDNIANSNYNAVVFVANQRVSHGLDFMVNIVRGAEIDDEGTFRSGFMPTRIERSRGIADTPTTIRGYAVYTLPFGQGRALGSGTAVGRVLAGGWMVSGIYTYSTGTPLAIIGSGCNTPGGGQCMPNYNTSFSGPVRINGKWGQGATATYSPNYINVSAFTNAIPPYTFGNVARTAPYGLRGPNNYDADLSVKKTIPIHERVNALFDVSAYNIANSTIFNVAGMNTGTLSTFGAVSSQANNSRDIQLAFRVNF